MGVKQSDPGQQIKFISYENFYQSIRSPAKSVDNIYQSRLSESLTGSNRLLQKSISFTETAEQINRYLTVYSDKIKQFEKNRSQSLMQQSLFASVVPSQRFDQNVFRLPKTRGNYIEKQLYYQNYDINIKNQINARRKICEKFSEEEIWYILYSSVNAIRMFEQFGMNSGNLKTDKILLDKRGHLKVVNMLSWPDTAEDIYQHNKNGLIKFYSPEELRVMRQKIDKKINYSIAETFSLGIVILELATFYSGEIFYDMNKMLLNDKALEQADQILLRNYSRLLYNLVKTMLSGIYDRPLPSQIYHVFQPFEDQILSLTPFNFTHEKNVSMYVSNASLMSL